MSLRKKFFGIITASMMFATSILCAVPASAANHTESGYYGFNVDLSNYYTPVWYNSVTSNCYMKGNLIGSCTTEIGVTRAKNRATGGYNMDQVMVRCLMKGKKAKRNYVGYSEHLTIESKLPSAASLMAYSPTQLAGSVKYNVGVNASSDGTVGISASTEITKDALEINSCSDTSAKLFKTCYDYQHSFWRWNWKLDRYSYNESIQRAHYVIKTKGNNYTTSIKITPKFERWDDTPRYWASGYGTYTSMTHILTLRTPY